MVKDFIMMIQEELTLKHVNFLTSDNPVEFLVKQSRDSRMATSQWNSLRRSLMSCSKSSKPLGRSQHQVSNFKLFLKTRSFNVTESFIKNSGQIHQHENQWLQDWAFREDQSTSSSNTFGCRTRSKRANSSSGRSVLTSIHQMCSQNIFQHQF